MFHTFFRVGYFAPQAGAILSLVVIHMDMKTCQLSMDYGVDRGHKDYPVFDLCILSNLFGNKCRVMAVG